MTQPAEEKTALYRRRGTAGTLTLQGSVDIFEAKIVHDAACRALADTKAQSVCADLSAVERLDLSGLQILSALRRDLELDGRTFVLQVPDTLAAALSQTGLGR